MNEPPRETVESALQLGGWSGTAVDLMEWYLHDYEAGFLDDEDDDYEWIFSQLSKLNSLLQSRTFELKQLAPEFHQGNTTT